MRDGGLRMFVMNMMDYDDFWRYDDTVATWKWMDDARWMLMGEDDD